jgi:hypothetical protein
MRFIKKFEKYTTDKQLNFEEVFGLSKSDIAGAISELIDNYDYIDFDLFTDDFKEFKIEIFESGLPEVRKELESEYEFFKKNNLDFLKNFLKSFNLKLVSEEYNKERRRIIIKVKRLKS